MRAEVSTSGPICFIHLFKLKIMKQYFIKWFSFLFPAPKVKSLAPKPLKAFGVVQKFLNTVPCINYGGCGISALALFDHAEAAGLKPKIVFGYGGSGGKKENDDYKLGNRPHAESATHIFIRIGGKDFDSKGEYDRDVHWEFDDEITRNHLVDSIRHGCWNSTFEREKWLPKIEKFIGYKLI